MAQLMGDTQHSICQFKSHSAKPCTPPGLFHCLVLIQTMLAMHHGRNAHESSREYSLNRCPVSGVHNSRLDVPDCMHKLAELKSRVRILLVQPNHSRPIPRKTICIETQVPHYVNDVFEPFGI